MNRQDKINYIKKETSIDDSFDFSKLSAKEVDQIYTLATEYVSHRDSYMDE